MNFKNKKRFKQAIIATSLVSMTVNAPVIMGVSEAASYAAENIKESSKTEEGICIARPNTPGNGNTPGKDSAIAPGVFEYTQKTLEKANIEFSKDEHHEVTIDNVYKSKSSYKLGTVTYQWDEKDVHEFGGWEAPKGKEFTIVQAGESSKLIDKNGNPTDETMITKIYSYDKMIENGKPVKITVQKLPDKPGEKPVGPGEMAGIGNYLDSTTKTFGTSTRYQQGTLPYEERSTRYFELGKEKGASISKSFKVNGGSKLKLGFAYKAVFTSTGSDYDTGEQVRASVTYNDGGVEKEILRITSAAGYKGWESCGSYFDVPEGVEEIKVTFTGIDTSKLVTNEKLEGFPNKQTKDAGIGAYLLGEIFLGTAPELEMSKDIKDKKEMYKKGDELDYNLEIKNVGCLTTNVYKITTVIPDGLEFIGSDKEEKNVTVEEKNGVKTLTVTGAEKLENFEGSKKTDNINLKFKVKDNFQGKAKIKSDLEWMVIKDKLLSDSKDQKCTYVSGETRKERDVEGSEAIRVTPDWGKKHTNPDLPLDSPENIAKRTQKISCVDALDVKIDTKVPNINAVNQTVEKGNEFKAKFEFNTGDNYDVSKVDGLVWNDNNELEEANPVKLSIKGDLPKGVEFNEEDKEFTGIPTEAGKHTITVVATDEAGNTTEKSFNLFVIDAPEKTIVKDMSNLTPKEIEAVKDAVKKANPGITDADIVVGTDGSVQIKDGDKNVKEFTPAEILGTIGKPEITYVKDQTSLTDDEKKAVQAKVEAIENFPEGATVEIADNGSTIVKVGERIIAEYTPEETVKEIGTPEKTVVLNKDALTDDEKDIIKDKIENLKDFPKGATVEIADNGEATVKLDGKTIAEYTQDETVDELGKPAITIVDDKTKLTDKDKEAVTEAIKDAKNMPENSVVTIKDNGTVVVESDGKKVVEYTVEELVKELPNPAITIVDDIDNLTDKDKEAVKNKINEAINIDLNGEVATITEEDGKIVVTLPDGRTIGTYEITDWVKELPNPNITTVKDKENLTPEEIKEVEKKISEIEGMPEGATITVNPDGSAVVENKDKKIIAKYTPEETVLELGEPEKTLVKDKENLTPEEIKAIEKKVSEIDGLPEGAIVEVEKDGSAKVTDKDRNPITEFTPEDLVVEVGTPEVTIVADKENLKPEDKEEIKNKVSKIDGLPEGAIVEVDEDGSAKVTDKDGNPIVEFTPEELLKELPTPEKVLVDDKENLKPEEIKAIEDSVANIDGLPEDAKINVNPNGSVEVKDADDKTIANFTPEETTKTLNPPKRTLVVDKEALTDDEKKLVEEAILEANPELKDKDVEIEVGDNGDTKVIVDGKETTFGQDETVEKISSIKPPKITLVEDTEDLTKAEKEKIKEAIKKENPEIKDEDIEVADNGETTVRFDDEEKVFTPEETVKKKSDLVINRPDVTPVIDTEDLTPEDIEKIEEAVEEANPELGKVTVDEDGTVKDEDGKTIFTPKETISKKTIRIPAITLVVDLTSLTPEEQDKVKEAIIKENPGLDEEKIDVDEKGNVVVDVSGEETKFTPEQTVKELEEREDGLNPPSIIRVYDDANLTPEEQEKVKEAVEKANPGIENVEVDEVGTVTVDGEEIFTPEDTVKEIAKDEIVEPGKVIVENPTNLTPEEQEKVKEAVKEVNPGIENVEVDEEGTVTVDGEEVFTPEQTVAKDLHKPEITIVKDDENLTPEEQEKVKEAVEEANPGIENVEVDENGNVTIDGKLEFIPGQTVEEKKKKPVRPGGGSHSNNGGGGSHSKPDHRISGKDRIETAVEVSKKAYPNGSDAVIIVNMEKFADVLTATPFAVHINAPILFVHKDSVPAETMAEIKRLGATKVYIAGGEASVSKKVADNFSNTHRFNGEDRYETAKLIAEKMRETGNRKIVEVASGELFADALSVSALAVRDDAPILLVEKNNMTAPTIKALTEWTDVERVNVAGYHATVSQGVEKSLGAINNSLTFRYGGADRYETSAIIAKEARPDSKFAVYTSGEVFADALVAAPYAGRRKAPVLLVTKTDVPAAIKTYTEGSKIRDFKLVGGENTVKQTVIEKILKITK